jgi:hypothetical protein
MGDGRWAMTNQAIEPSEHCAPGSMFRIAGDLLPSSVVSRPSTSVSSLPVLAMGMHETVDVCAVLLDQLADVLGPLAGVGAGIGDCAAEPYVVAHVIRPVGVFEESVDIGLTNAESSVEVPSLVRLAAI